MDLSLVRRLRGERAREEASGPAAQQMPDMVSRSPASAPPPRLEFEGGGHVCLAGASVTNDWSLIEPLKRRNQVTIVERLRMLHANSILTTADVLVLDCGEQPERALALVGMVRRVYPDVSVVLVNGALSAGEIAGAFREGVRDYFSHYSSADLVVERVENLCRQARRQVVAGGPARGGRA